MYLVVNVLSYTETRVCEWRIMYSISIIYFCSAKPHLGEFAPWSWIYTEVSLLRVSSSRHNATLIRMGMSFIICVLFRWTEHICAAKLSQDTAWYDTAWKGCLRRKWTLWPSSFPHFPLAAPSWNTGGTLCALAQIHLTSVSPHRYWGRAPELNIQLNSQVCLKTLILLHNTFCSCFKMDRHIDVLWIEAGVFAYTLPQGVLGSWRGGASVRLMLSHLSSYLLQSINTDVCVWAPAGHCVCMRWLLLAVCEITDLWCHVHEKLCVCIWGKTLSHVHGFLLLFLYFTKTLERDRELKRENFFAQQDEREDYFL